MGRFGNVMLINGETEFSRRGRGRRGRAPVPGEHGQHPDLQRRPPRRPHEAGRRRQRPLRARGVRRRGPALALGAGGRRRAVRHARETSASSTGPRSTPTTSGAFIGRGRGGRATPPAPSSELRIDPELTAERERIAARPRARARQDARLRLRRCRSSTAKSGAGVLLRLSDAPRGHRHRAGPARSAG